MRDFSIRVWEEERGTAAVEFAIVGPLFIGLVIGILYVGLSLLLVNSLHFAVEDAARCASVRTTVCKDGPTTIAYAQSRYFGPGTPTFSAPAPAACGNNYMSASINYVADLGLTQFTLPIAASACFP